MAEVATALGPMATGTSQLTLVVGAKGSLAERVTDALLTRGLRVRLVLEPGSFGSPRPELLALKARGAELVVADLSSAAELLAALREVRRVVFAPTSAVRQGVSSIETLQAGAAAPLVEAVVRARPERLVFVSEGSLSGASRHVSREAEARLMGSGLGVTFIQPLPVIAAHSEAQRFGEEGRRVAFVSLAQVADLAVRALCDPLRQQTLYARADTFLQDELLWAVEEVVRLSGESRGLLHAGLLGLLGRPRPLADELLAALVLGAELKLISAPVARALGLGLSPVADTLAADALEPS